MQTYTLITQMVLAYSKNIRMNSVEKWFGIWFGSRSILNVKANNKRYHWHLLWNALWGINCYNRNAGATSCGSYIRHHTLSWRSSKRSEPRSFEAVGSILYRGVLVRKNKFSLIDHDLSLCCMYFLIVYRNIKRLWVKIFFNKY